MGTTEAHSIDGYSELDGLTSAEFLEKNRFLVVPKLLDPMTIQFLSSYYSVMQFDESGRFGRDRTSMNAYGDACADICLYMLRERLEQITGIELIPTFSFVRYYKNGDRLPRHNDRQCAEINVTTTITCDADWPINFRHKFGGPEYSLTTKPGQAVVYYGNELEHWRDKYKGETQVQIITSFIIKGGRFDTPQFRFDGHGAPIYAPTFVPPQPLTDAPKRKAFVLWRNFKHRLGLPEYRD